MTFAFGQNAIPQSTPDHAGTSIGQVMAEAAGYIGGIESEIAANIIQSWLASKTRIKQEMEALLTKVEERQSMGLPVSKSWLYQTEQLKSVYAQIDNELQAVAKQLPQETAAAAKAAADIGVSDLADKIEATIKDTIPEGAKAGISKTFGGIQVNGTMIPVNAPSPKAIATLVARLENPKSPLFQTLAADFGSDAKKIKQSLEHGILTGKNPRVIAREFNKGLDMPGYRAERIARTEVLEAYRESSRAAMQANEDVVKGWMWYAGIRSCCGACLAMHGKTFPTDEKMGTHPNCRCALVPRVRDWSELGIPGLEELDEKTGFDGPDAKLIGAERAKAMKQVTGSTKAQLQKRFGLTKAELLHGKHITLGDLVAERHSKVWGVSRTEISASALLEKLGVSIGKGSYQTMAKRTATALKGVKPLHAGKVSYKPVTKAGPDFIDLIEDAKFGDFGKQAFKYTDASAVTPTPLVGGAPKMFMGKYNVGDVVDKSDIIEMPNPGKKAKKYALKDEPEIGVYYKTGVGPVVKKPPAGWKPSSAGPMPKQTDFSMSIPVAPKKAGAIPDYQHKQLTLGSGAGGTTGAKWATDELGDKWLVKFGGDNANRVAVELVSNQIYREMGATVAEAGSIVIDGKKALTYKALDGKSKKFADSAELGEHYMTDALLGNWDYVGASQDNILWNAAGKPIRIDQGGTLMFRAQGETKPFGKVPDEVESLFLMGQAKGRVKLTYDGLKQQAQDIGQKLTAAKIDAIIDAAPFESNILRNHARTALKERVQWMRDFANGKVDVSDAFKKAIGHNTVIPDVTPKPVGVGAAPKKLVKKSTTGKSYYVGDEIPANKVTYHSWNPDSGGLYTVKYNKDVFVKNEGGKYYVADPDDLSKSVKPGAGMIDLEGELNFKDGITVSYDELSDFGVTTSTKWSYVGGQWYNNETGDMFLEVHGSGKWVFKKAENTVNDGLDVFHKAEVTFYDGKYYLKSDPTVIVSWSNAHGGYVKSGSEFAAKAPATQAKYKPGDIVPADEVEYDQGYYFIKGMPHVQENQVFLKGAGKNAGKYQLYDPKYANASPSSMPIAQAKYKPGDMVDANDKMPNPNGKKGKYVLKEDPQLEVYYKKGEGWKVKKAPPGWKPGGAHATSVKAKPTAQKTLVHPDHAEPGDIVSAVGIHSENIDGGLMKILNNNGDEMYAKQISYKWTVVYKNGKVLAGHENVAGIIQNHAKLQEAYKNAKFTFKGVKESLNKNTVGWIESRVSSGKFKSLVEAAKGDGVGGAAASKWISAFTKKVTFPTDVKNAVRTYTGGSYHTWNKLLRRGDMLDPQWAKQYREYTSLVDKAFEMSNPISKELNVKRGVSVEVAEQIIGAHDNGLMFMDHGFVSTSTKEQWNCGAWTIELVVPRGSKAIWVNALGGMHPGECEVLLNRGAMFEVLGFDRSTKTIRAVYRGSHSYDTNMGA